jgi:hypothetical protein
MYEGKHNDTTGASMVGRQYMPDHTHWDGSIDTLAATVAHRFC